MTIAADVLAAIPQELRVIAGLCDGYGITIMQDPSTRRWTITQPTGSQYVPPRPNWDNASLAEALFRHLRGFEEKAGILVDFEQFDPDWSRVVYGDPEHDPEGSTTTIRRGGCGPTTLATLLQYEVGRTSYSSGTREITPTMLPNVTAGNANRRGYGHAIQRNRGTQQWESAGTDGDAMMRRVQSDYPGFEGQRLGTMDAVIMTLRTGALVNFLCRGCAGETRSGASKQYGGHFMVLAGVWGAANSETFMVLDCGGNADDGMARINRSNLAANNGGFWVVNRRSPT